MRTLYHFRGAIACALLALLAIAYGCERQHTAELRGALTARDSVLRANGVRLERLKVRVDTVHRVDSVRFDRWRTVYTHTADTVRVRDTLYVRKELADSVVRSCSLALNSCEEAKALRDSIIANERARREAVERMLANTVRAARTAKPVWGALGAAVGFGACTLAR